MKTLTVLFVLFMCGCVSIEMPGLVPDVVKATKDLYAGTSTDKTTNRVETTSRQPVLAHSYVGKINQTNAEIKHVCVAEASQMLRLIAGKDVSYSVLRNDIVMINNTAFANCELAIDD